MQNFNIVKKNELKNKSYRVSKICDQFDYDKNEVKEIFKGSIIYPEKWNIGLIVGKSGTGKSTILKELYKDFLCKFKYKESCVIDDFNKNIEYDNLVKTLFSVGFSSVPSWLKPYSVLSNGEKMRIDLARALLQEKEIICFDEYTSVIDREVAKIGAMATKKIINKTNKKFIASTCHFDIIEWLQPDWIFSTDKMEMLPRGSLQRPQIKIEIRKKRGYWDIFRRYHYLNHDINKAATQYIGEYNNKSIAFCAVINVPHPYIKPMRKIHRLVVLPDYQGIGIGKKILNKICSLYKQKNEYIGITTSLNMFAKSLIKDKNWKYKRGGRVGKHKMERLNKTVSKNRNTYSLEYIGLQEVHI